MSKLKELYSSKSFRENGHALIDLLGDYLEAIEKKSISKVIPFQEPDEAFSFWQNDFEKKFAFCNTYPFNVVFQN